MQKAGIKKIIRKYAKTLRVRKIPVSGMYLFGSYARGTANKWSDIDVAVISNKLRRNYERNRTMINRASLDVDHRLEPHPFTPEGFKNDADPLAYEIRKTGVQII